MFKVQKIFSYIIGIIFGIILARLPHAMMDRSNARSWNLVMLSWCLVVVSMVLEPIPLLMRRGWFMVSMPHRWLSRMECAILIKHSGFLYPWVFETRRKSVPCQWHWEDQGAPHLATKIRWIRREQAIHGVGCYGRSDPEDESHG